jgi:O-antigen ligase
VPLCLFGLTDGRLGAARLLFEPALVLFGVVLGHTYSRGGFLALCAGLLTLFQARCGWRKSLALGALALPVLVVLFAGRMTSISASEGTGQGRIQLWSDWLDAFRSSPLLGVGTSNNDKVQITHVAHNSFLQCFADLGLFGGVLFIGAFYFAFLTLRRAAAAPAVSPQMVRLRPYLLAVLVGSAVSLLTLSLPYVIPTYMIVGLATVYAGVALVPRPAPLLRCDLQLVQRVVLVSIAWLASVYLFVRVFRV